MLKPAVRSTLFVACLIVSSPLLDAQEPSVQYIDTSFENASPLWYQFAEDHTVEVHLMYDHERDSPNRAAGHLHFRVLAPAGSNCTLEIKNLDNVWNGQPGSVARELKTVVVSEDGQHWRSLATEVSEDLRVRIALTIPENQTGLYVARVEPYRISNLERLLDDLRNSTTAPVEIKLLGKTVEGRDLEIVRLGNPQAPYRVFLRARAHPWEAGGNWVLEGVLRRLLQNDEMARQCLQSYCVYALPMANKDGVARGRTRFNSRGKDLNRNWNLPTNEFLAPENFALEQWLKGMIDQGSAPHFAMELHNDGNGKLHISRPPIDNLQRYLDRMGVFESLLRRHTWFTEGATNGAFRNSGTLGDGWLERFGVDAVVHEFNCHWIAGRQEPPLAKHWREYGEQLTLALRDYFAAIKP